MYEINIYSIDGSKKDSLKIEESAVGGAEVSPSLLHRAVVSYEANARQGNACTKTKGERSGAGSKPWRQKGTGRARVGSIRSPLWRGGGVIFGPKPRDYTMKLSKKEKKTALRAAIAGKMRDSEVCALESFDLSEVKTRVVAGFIKASQLEGRVLFVSNGIHSDFFRASKNIPNVEVLPVSDLNALNVLKGGTLIFDKAALESFLAGGDEK